MNYHGEIGMNRSWLRAMAFACVMSMLVMLAACGGKPAPAAPVKVASPIAKADIVALIRSAARSHYPDFEARKRSAIVDVDGYLQFLSGPDALPSVSAEPDAATRALYEDAATLYSLREIVAAHALVSTVQSKSDTGVKLMALIEMAYDPVGGEDLDGDDGGTGSRDLTVLAARTHVALKSLATAGLVGQQAGLAKMIVRAEIYATDNGVAYDAATSAIAQTGNDRRTRAAIQKALTDAYAH